MDRLAFIELTNKPLGTFIEAAGIVVVGILLAQGIRFFAERPSRKGTGDEGAVSRALARRTVHGLLLPSIYIGSLYVGLTILDLAPKTQRIVDTVALVAASWFLVRYATHSLHVVIAHWLGKRGHEFSRQRLKPLLVIADVALWISALIFLLDNFGFKISSVVAGLGIGGITVALASQAVLGDLFSYFVILFDRPFEQGDCIVAGDLSGTIEAIGVKTTKLRSLGGELIVIANSQLTNSKVHNYKRMERRRVLFTVSVVYDTPREVLEAIPGILRRAIEAREDTTFDRAHFRGFGASSLDFEIVYFVMSSDYLRYMDIQQAINLDIVGSFAREGVSFAFPTQSIRLER